MQLIISKSNQYDFKLSRIVSKGSHIGIIVLIVSTVTLISSFAYFSFYSNMNAGFDGNNFMSNTVGLTNHLINNVNNVQKIDDSTSSSSILVAVWLGLMILGIFLLYHIHFKVLPRG